MEKAVAECKARGPDPLPSGHPPQGREERDSHAVSLDEELGSLFQQILLDPDKEVPDVPWRGRQRPNYCQIQMTPDPQNLAWTRRR